MLDGCLRTVKVVAMIIIRVIVSYSYTKRAIVLVVTTRFQIILVIDHVFTFCCSAEICSLWCCQQYDVDNMMTTFMLYNSDMHCNTNIHPSIFKPFE